MTAGAGSRALAPNAVATTTFVPITPCRIVDTRVAGGVLAGNTIRDFYVAGKTGFAGQGGSGTCGIPEHATAVAATLTAVTPTGNGFIRAWPVGQPAPLATLLNYQKTSGGIGTGTTLSIKAGAGKDVRVRNLNASTHLVIDVTGYYASPMWASINTLGAVINSSGDVVGSTKVNNGLYQVDFASPVDGCAISGTALSSWYNVGASTSPAFDKRVVVVIRDVEYHNEANSAFMITVTC